MHAVHIYYLHLLPIRSDIAALGESLVPHHVSCHVSTGSPNRCAAVAVVTAGSGCAPVSVTFLKLI
jgi:hypothetical protein